MRSLEVSSRISRPQTGEAMPFPLRISRGHGMHAPGAAAYFLGNRRLGLVDAKTSHLCGAAVRPILSGADCALIPAIRPQAGDHGSISVRRTHREPEHARSTGERCQCHLTASESASETVWAYVPLSHDDPEHCSDANRVSTSTDISACAESASREAAKIPRCSSCKAGPSAIAERRPGEALRPPKRDPV